MKLITREEHRTRTPGCPFFVTSRPVSNASFVGNVNAVPATRSSKKSGLGIDAEPCLPPKNKNNKRHLHQHSPLEDEGEAPEKHISPRSKRPRITPIVLITLRAKSSSTMQRNTPSKVSTPSKPTRIAATKSSPDKHSVATDIHPVKTPVENSASPIGNRRITRSTSTLLLLGGIPTHQKRLATKKTIVKSKPKQSKPKTRQASVLTKSVKEIDKPRTRRNRSAKGIHPDTKDGLLPEDANQYNSKSPLKGQARVGNVAESRDVEQLSENPTPVSPRTPSSGISSEAIQFNNEEPKAEEPPIALKSGNASVQTVRTDSETVQESLGIDDTKPVPYELPTSTKFDLPAIYASGETNDAEMQVELKGIPACATPVNSHAKGDERYERGGNEEVSAFCSSKLLTSAKESSPPNKPAYPERMVITRDTSAIEGETSEPPAKAHENQWIEAISSPLENIKEGVVEDSKFTLSNEDALPINAEPNFGVLKSCLHAASAHEDRPPRRNFCREDSISLSSHSSVSCMTTPEMVENAKKELEEDWVDNKDIEHQAACDEDRRDQSSQESGDKPAPIVQNKGQRAQESNNVDSDFDPVALDGTEDNDDESIGETPAFFMKAYPVFEGLYEDTSEEEKRTSNGQATSMRSDEIPRWAPIKPVVPVINMDFTEEANLSVEEWMNRVIDNEVTRLAVGGEEWFKMWKEDRMQG